MHKVFPCRKERHTWWRGEARGRGGEGRVGGGVILSHCLIGCPVHCCVMWRWSNWRPRVFSSTRGQRRHSHPCQKCCSHAHRVHVAASAAARGMGAGWMELAETEGVIEDCGMCSWWRHVFSRHAGAGDAFRGLTCLAPGLWEEEEAAAASR